jgi:hypothetical protein
MSIVCEFLKLLDSIAEIGEEGFNKRVEFEKLAFLAFEIKLYPYNTVSPLVIRPLSSSIIPTDHLRPNFNNPYIHFPSPIILTLANLPQLCTIQPKDSCNQNLILRILYLLLDEGIQREEKFFPF